MNRKFKYLQINLLIGLFTFISVFGFSQSSPVPFDMYFSGNYLFDNWPAASLAGTYPANARFHRTGTVNPTLATPTINDYTGNYAPAAGSAKIDGLGAGGFAFSNDVTINDHNLGAFVVGLNTTGRTGITINNFTAQGTSAGALYNLRLQYRLSKWSTWVDVPGPFEFVGTGGITGATIIGPVALSTITANAVDNRANLQVRWKYYYVSGAGSPSKIRLDAINILSTPLAGNYTSVDSISSTPKCITATTGMALNVPVRCEPRASFTAATTFTVQLSDAAGSFAAPVTIGNAASTAAGTGSQTIPCVIPAGTPYGTGYRIRVLSNVAGFVAANASDNVVPFTIFQSPGSVTGLLSACSTGAATISWTLPTTSCFNDVLVVASANVAVAGSPSGNGSAYTANTVYGSGTAFGSGFVIYKGGSTSVVTTNLTDGVPYYFSVWVRYGTEWSLVSVTNCIPDYATKIVVNGYLNTTTPSSEWTELLVTGDNVDLRNFNIRDNNGTQTGWQQFVTFGNIPLWNNLRRGTVIMLWHRTQIRPIDINKDDGYLELELNPGSITPYFSGGDAANTLNLAGSGDIVQVTGPAPAYTHVHALGHQGTPGTSWTGLTPPKLNHATSVVDGDAVYVCPGGTISNYNGPSGTSLTASNSTTITFGLPNTCGSAPTQNGAFWKQLRQPVFASQTVSLTGIAPGMPGSVTFTWLPATDPNPADNTVGYIILRDPSNVFSAIPQDGTTYSVGSALGTATIVGQINNSLLTTFTDNTVMNGNVYNYRVYAFRYATDNVNGNTFNSSRGRAYNETNFVSVGWPPIGPLPVELVSFTGTKKDKTVRLNWHTSSETNNDYFLIEKSTDGYNFEPLGTVKGAGSSSVDHFYNLNDLNPNQGINYYGLTQFDYNGDRSVRKVVAVRFSEKNPMDVLVYPNPFNNEIQFNCSSSINGDIKISLYDYVGQVLLNEQHTIQEGYNHYVLNPVGLSSGVYFIEVQSEESIFRGKIVKK
jgi:hypothetical protein